MVPFPKTVPSTGFQWTNDLWSGVTPTILIRDSLPLIDIQAFTFPPASDGELQSLMPNAIALDVLRAPDDNPNIQGYPNVPTRGPTTLGGTTLSLDQTGSFLALAFIDTNGNGRWDAGETGMSLPLILVQATVHRNLSSTPQPSVSYNRVTDANGAWAESRIRTGALCGTANGLDLRLCPVMLAAEVDLVGGGNAGPRGTGQVYGGWVQNLGTPNVIATYQNNHQDVWVFAGNRAATQTPGLFLQNDPSPQVLPGPLLDDINPAPGTGGNTSLMSPSQQDVLLLAQVPGPFNADPAPNLGKRTLITSFDATLADFNSFHWIFQNSTLTGVGYNLNFSTFLTLWSSGAGVADATSGTPPPVGAIAERTYGVILQQNWSIASTFTDIDGTGHVGASISSVTLGQPLTFNNQGVAPLSAVVLGPPTVQAAQADNYKQ